MLLLFSVEHERAFCENVAAKREVRISVNVSDRQDVK